jgi:hypothetical protein
MIVPNMPAQSTPVGQFAERHRREMIPLSKPFSYFSAAVPLSEEDIREYLEEPIAALPPSILDCLPKVSILLVPYLERVGGRANGLKPSDMVVLEKPSRDRSWTSCYVNKDKQEAVLAFAVKDQEVADYHYRFYHSLAELMAEHWTDDARRQYSALVREELQAGVHGEVDEESWHLKQKLRPSSWKKDTKLFRLYSKQSFIDTLTLFLHGICCDIDVDTGPRQLQSRLLRKRLQLLQSLYPLPSGYALFPEELDRK